MNIFITLDYELFFGNNSGTVENCIINPTIKLLNILDANNIKAVFFVDVGYLVKLEEYKNKYQNLEKDYQLITNQIKKLANEGHSIELHIHPHWEDTIYNGKKWIFNTSRYKLTDFLENEILNIVTKYKNTLENISNKPIIAYRAGGWSIQPFNKIGKALEKNNIFIDSTVYPNGYYNSKYQSFDFIKTPKNITKWNFSNNPTVEDKNGIFIEIPISSIKVSPLFFWKFALTKIVKLKKHQAIGDGSAIKLNNSQIKKLLLKSSYTVVSIDGYKSSLLNKSLKKYSKLKENNSNLVLIGHPKAFTPFSLKKLSKFISKNKNNHKFVTYK